MRIRMLTSVAGEGFSHAPGEEGTGIPPKERRRFVEAGLAEEIKTKSSAAKSKAG